MTSVITGSGATCTDDGPGSWPEKSRVTPGSRRGGCANCSSPLVSTEREDAVARTTAGE